MIAKTEQGDVQPSTDCSPGGAFSFSTSYQHQTADYRHYFTDLTLILRCSVPFFAEFKPYLLVTVICGSLRTQLGFLTSLSAGDGAEDNNIIPNEQKVCCVRQLYCI